MADKIGPYEIRGELGRGAMAVVWRGWDPKLAREVAIKEPLTSGMAGVAAAELAERFVREGQAAARLNHPGIIAIYNADVYDGRAALVMELVEGTTLCKVIARGPLPVERVTSILDHLLYAMAYAHSRGVVHRDIKPDNVFVTDDGGVKLADFGIARIGAGAALTRVGSTLGTPGYMSPEQVKGTPADERSDVFAAAAMGYEMLTGHNPFGATDTPDPTVVMYRIVHEDVPPIEQMVAGVPAGLAAAITRGMAKDPAQRFQSAEQMRAVLRGMTDASSVVTQAVTPQSFPGTVVSTQAAVAAGSGDYSAQAPGSGDYGAVVPGSGDYTYATSGDYGQASAAIAAPGPGTPPRSSGLRTGLIVGGIVVAVVGALGMCSMFGMCALLGWDTNPPTVSITAPRSNTAAAPGQALEVLVSAADKEGLSSVAVLVNGKQVAKMDKPPFKASLTTPAKGTMIIEAVALDTGGNETKSGKVTVKIVDFAPEDTVNLFWSAIGSNDPVSAWNALSPSAQQSEGSYDKFKASIQNVLDGSLQFVSATTQSVNGDVAVTKFTISVGDAGNKNMAPKTGTMNMSRIQGLWYIDGMTLD